MRLSRRTTPPVGLRSAAGERVLAWSPTDDGRLVGGTRDALYVVSDDGTTRLPWEQVEAADWDAETTRLRVTEVGSWGEVRPVHELVLEEAALLLELVRERVTASVVLQRHVPVSGRRGVRVIARRAPRGDRAPAWFFQYDEGVDADDPAVRRAAQEALARAQQDVGLD